MSGESRQASPFFCVSRPPARGSPDPSPALASRLGCAWRHSAAAAWFRHGYQLIASVEWHGAAQTCRFAPQIISSAKIIRRGSRAAETAKYCATTQTDVFVLLPPAAPHTQTHTPVPRAVHVQVLPRNEQVGATRLLTQGAPRTILRLTTLLTRKHGLCLACVAEAVQVRSQAQGVALGNVFLSKVAVRRGSRGCGAPVKPSGPQPSARTLRGGALHREKNKKNYNPYISAFLLALFESGDEPQSPGEPEEGETTSSRRVVGSSQRRGHGWRVVVTADDRACRVCTQRSA